MPTSADYQNTVSSLDTLRKQKQVEQQVLQQGPDTTSVFLREAQLANLQKISAQATERLAVLHADIKNSLGTEKRSPQQEKTLDEKIDQAVRLRKRLDYFGEVGKEISAADQGSNFMDRVVGQPYQGILADPAEAARLRSVDANIK